MSSIESVNFDELPAASIALIRIGNDVGEVICEALCDHLNDDHNSDILLESCMDGGWPAENIYEPRLDRCRREGDDHWIANFSLFFDEEIPSSCKDMPNISPRRTDIEVRVSVGNGAIETKFTPFDITEFDQY